jgi:hypothetical protein
MKALVGVVAGACMALVVACASVKNSAAPAPQSVGAPPPSPVGPSPHDQIEKFGQDITDARVKMGLPAAPEVVAPCPNGQCSGPAPTAMSTHSDPACHPATSDTCSSTCTLADSICDNASKICALAKELPGDTWASDHCASATTSCHDAHERCCGCQ